MDDGTSEQRHCEVCGRRLFRNNTTGLCSGLGGTPECRRLREERRRRSNGVQPRGPKRCGHPDGCPQVNARNGLCDTHASRLERSGELGPADLIRKPIEILAGSVFGKWTAMEDYNLTDRRVLCRCACGTGTMSRAISLKKGATRSCGCLRRTHGLSSHPLYATWVSMNGRTGKPGNRDYRNWGGRGVCVYEPWRTDVAAFIAWIEANIGPRPDGMTLDRWPDNNGNYEPGNVRWATRVEQSENQRKVSTLTLERDALAIRLAEVERQLAEARGVLF
jgi:hypothetical protein